MGKLGKRVLLKELLRPSIVPSAGTNFSAGLLVSQRRLRRPGLMTQIFSPTADTWLRELRENVPEG